jgi:hypothetical protein
MAESRVHHGELPFFVGKREALLQGDPRKLQLKIVTDRAAVLRNPRSSADCVLSPLVTVVDRKAAAKIRTGDASSWLTR